MDAGALTLDPVPAAITEARAAASSPASSGSSRAVLEERRQANPGDEYEQAVAPQLVSIQVDGQGDAFPASYWRFLNEPAGGHIGAL
jgi:hypothetical protein